MAIINDNKPLCSFSIRGREIQVTPALIGKTLILLVIIVSGAILFMALTGMLTFQEKETKAAWIETNSQILNAIFSFLAFISFPWRFLDCLRLERKMPPWTGLDAPIKYLKLSNSLTQLPISIVMWNTGPENRPNWVIAVFLPLSFGSIVLASYLEYRVAKKAKDLQLNGVEL